MESTMECKKEEPALDTSIQQRKFGLPGWMVNNIERLNFVTDFEQYACSPPETEGFLSEYKESHDVFQNSEPHCPIVESKVVQNESIQNVSEVQSNSSLSKLIINPVDQLPSIHHTISNIRHEELISSPDSTPCATPEPSPVIRRKVSNPTDTVITNPGRWFYIGKVKLPKNIKDSPNNKNKAKCDERSVTAVNMSDSVINTKQNGIKLMISNFDLNAVSPTSW